MFVAFLWGKNPSVFEMLTLQDSYEGLIDGHSKDSQSHKLLGWGLNIQSPYVSRGTKEK